MTPQPLQQRPGALDHIQTARRTAHGRWAACWLMCALHAGDVAAAAQGAEPDHAAQVQAAVQAQVQPPVQSPVQPQTQSPSPAESTAKAAVSSAPAPAATTAPKAEPLALALPNGRRLMTLGESGPEQLIQILKLLGGLALASTACAVMATWLAPRRAPREAFVYPEPTPTALPKNPYPGAPTAPRWGEVVATGQPWQGRSVPAASPYQPARQDSREVAEA